MILIDIKKYLKSSPAVFFVFIAHVRLIVGERCERPSNVS